MSASAAPSYVAAEDRRLAHGVHLLALAGASHAVTPGYARADARLRAALGERAPRLDADQLPTFDALLAGDPARDLDSDWFARRWDSAGERQSAAGEAARVADEAAATGTGGLLPGWTVAVSVATGLRVGAWARTVDAAAHRIGVAVGPGTPGALVALAAIAARLPLDPRVARLPPPDRDQVRLHCAGSVLALALGDGPEMTALLEASVDVLLPPQHQGERTVKLIARLRAENLLDQPPGEIERLGQGLARRYPDRLHRAWLRGFFVPRGQSAAAWLGALRSERA